MVRPPVVDGIASCSCRWRSGSPGSPRATVASATSPPARVWCSTTRSDTRSRSPVGGAQKGVHPRARTGDTSPVGVHAVAPVERSPRSDSADPTEGSTPPGATVWRWRRWTRWSLTPATIAVAGLAVGTDIAASWMGLLPGSLGRVPVAGTVPIGIALGLMVGLRRLGLDRTNLLVWREFLAVGGVALVVGVWQYSIRIGGFGEAMGLVLAALNEELIYRLAVLVLAGAGAAKLAGRNWRATADWGVGPGVVAILAVGVRVHAPPRAPRAGQRRVARASVRGARHRVGICRAADRRDPPRRDGARAAQPRDDRRAERRDLSRIAHVVGGDCARRGRCSARSSPGGAWASTAANRSS